MLAGAVGLIVGCSAPRPVLDVTNPDLSGKIPAIRAAVDNRDMSAVRQLVKDLDSDDAAVRFYAIQGLQRLTNETFGYQYFADETARKPALEKWNAWLAGWEAAAGFRDN